MEDIVFIKKRNLITSIIYLALVFNIGIAYSKPIVVVSIAPLQALVHGIAGDKAEIIQIVPVNMSPHAYALKPTDLSKIQQADMIFWVGPQMEYFLSKLLEKSDISKKTNTLIETKGLTLWMLRQGQEWGRHEHETPELNTDQSNLDPHIWLDPNNAKKMLETITAALVSADPDNKTYYLEALKKRTKELETLDKNLLQELEPIKTKPYLVFHDGYQYFEKHYGLNDLGTILSNPEIPLSGKQLNEIHEKIQHSKIVCVVTEPQINEKLAQNIIKGTDAKLVLLDPLDTGASKGWDGYTILLKKNAQALLSCLTTQSERPAQQPD